MHDRLKIGNREKMRAIASPAVDLSIVMPTIAWDGTFEACARRALEVIDSSACRAELIVVLDGETKTPPRWLLRPDVQVVNTGTRSGPAVARNHASTSARSEVLFFVDADVELGHGAVDRVHDRFRVDPDLDAMFGAYDDEPAAPGTASQFRNLLHHHNHVAHPGRAPTFWAGCGAMRTSRFREVGGFDPRYRKPSIEDIELGTRVSAAGGRIEIDPDLRCKHHKRWTLQSMVKTDITCRAVPWTRLMCDTRRMPACLAIDWRSRASGGLAMLGTIAVPAAALLTPWLLAVTAACAAGVFLLNARFYRLCRRKRGTAFAAACFALHFLFFFYSTLTFATVAAYSLAVPPRGSDDPQPVDAARPAAAPTVR